MKKSTDLLLRFSLDNSNKVQLKGEGRGAWLCRDSLKCMEIAFNKGLLKRAFRCSSDEIDISVLKLAASDLF